MNLTQTNITPNQPKIATQISDFWVKYFQFNVKKILNLIHSFN
jgi:hypothetical protein